MRYSQGGNGLTCSNCAEYDPSMSIRGGYISTTPCETRRFIYHFRQQFGSENSFGHAYPRQVSLNAEPFEITTTKHKGAEVLVDLLVERSSRCQVRRDLLRCEWVFSIPIDARLYSNMTSVLLSSRMARIVAILTPLVVEPLPVEPNVSQAKISPSSILV